MNLFQAAGSRDDKETRFAPIYTSRFFLGLHTNRNPLRSPAGIIYDTYYKIGGSDALISGSNVELSNRLTICRRPGNTAGLSTFISSSNVPDIIDSFYSFHEIGGNVRVFADTPTAPYLVGGAVNNVGTASQGIIPIFTKAAGVVQSFFQGVGQSLYFSDALEQQKWLDFGAGLPGNSLAVITNVSLTSNVATITAVNNFTVGQTVVISQTTTSSGLFNVTAKLTAVTTAQFSFNLTHANVGSVADTGFASGTWNLGIVAPSTSPTIKITASGSAATIWQANTVFSTMGLVFDSGTTSIQQLISVNSSGTNTTQFGTSGNGDPPWNQTPGGTTTDNTITWTNWGPIPAWAAHQLYNNAATGGTLANPSQVYDPSVKVMPFNGTPGFNQGTSGGSKPNFLAIAGANLHDPANQDSPPAVKWFSMFPAPARWKASTSYPNFFTGGTLTQQGKTSVVEPFPLPAPNNQICFLQVSNGGTSGSGYTPAFSAIATTQISDNDLIWQSLGSATWQANTVYTPWISFPQVFSAIKDSNGNLQVCIAATGNAQSGSTQPLQAWQAGHVYSNGNTISDSNGRLQTVTAGGTSGLSRTLTTSDITAGVATYTTSVNHGYSAGQYVTITSSSHDPAFNVTNALITSIPTAAKFTINLAHDDIASGGDVGNSKAGPTWATVLGNTTTDGGVTWTAGALQAGWGVKYGDNTRDGNITWTCVGTPLTWATSTIYHVPTTGFAPPTGSQPFGGSEIISGTSPNQNVQAVIVSGKSGGGGSPTFSTTAGNFTDDNTVVWQNVATFSQTTNSLAFSHGYSWCYSYKSRTVTDQYSPVAGGGLGLIPPGFFAGSPNGSLAFGPPTGSADGSVSTSSPTITTTGADTGAIITVAGIGSTDPQVDTIVIFRTADGGATFYELTEIPNPPAIQGVAQGWTFLDFLPDNATANFPGLNTLVIAPLAVTHFNDPPLTGAINLVQHLARTFYSVGATVYASNGPLVGGASQPPGNGYTSFNPAQFWTFPSPVTRMVPTTSGLLVFTTSDTGIIVGGPAISTLFAYIRIPGLGLTSYNALAIKTGIIYLLTADNQGVSLDPNLGISEVGFPIGDQINTISPSNAYAAFLIQGSNDKGFYLADGSTGWFRCNPNQSPDSAISGPVWSPKATIVGGVKAIAALEVKPGQQALLLGATSANHPILVRDSTYTTFTDNGSTYSADYTFGSIVLANPGQLAEVGFITCEFEKVGTSPKLSVLLDEIADTVISISAAVQSAGNTTYTYTLISGPAVATNMFFTISGMADSGNNGTFLVTGTGAGTFTVVNANGVTRAVQTGAGTRFEDLSGYVAAATGLPPQDSPYIWGLTLNPNSIFANRYYMLQSVNGIVPPFGAFCRHMQIKISYGTDSVQNELLSETIFGAHVGEL